MIKPSLEPAQREVGDTTQVKYTSVFMSFNPKLSTILGGVNRVLPTNYPVEMTNDDRIILKPSALILKPYFVGIGQWKLAANQKVFNDKSKVFISGVLHDSQGVPIYRDPILTTELMLPLTQAQDALFLLRLVGAIQKDMGYYPSFLYTLSKADTAWKTENFELLWEGYQRGGIHTALQMGVKRLKGASVNERPMDISALTLTPSVGKVPTEINPIIAENVKNRIDYLTNKCGSTLSHHVFFANLGG
jgi:hypothetical protein